MTQCIVYWFRNDLRLNDNEAFFKATEASQLIIPVYVFDPRLFDQTRFGFKRTGYLRANHIIQTVKQLRKDLRSCGSDLIIRIGYPETIIANLADKFQATYVYTSKKIGPKETRIEASLSKRLKISNIDIKLPWNDTLVPVSALPFPIAKLPSTFEQYLNSIQNVAFATQPLLAPTNLKLNIEYDAGILPNLTTLGIDTQGVSTADFNSGLDGGEFTATLHLDQFIADLADGKYANTQDPIMDSSLAIWLSIGCLSLRQIHHKLMTISDTNPMKLISINNLHVRDYAQFTLLKYGPRLFKASGIQHKFETKWKNDEKLFEDWRNGQTNNLEVNAIMQKLNSEGQSSIQERYKAAHYLVDDLRIDWTWGATYFESRLLDYDVAISWGRWNEVAKVGNL